MKITKQQLLSLINENIKTSVFSDRLYIEIYQFLFKEVFIFENFNSTHVKPDSPSWDDGRAEKVFSNKQFKMVKEFFSAQKVLKQHKHQQYSYYKELFDANKENGMYIFWIKEEKIKELFKKFESKIINKFIGEFKDLGKKQNKIKQDLMNLFKPGGVGLLFIVTRYAYFHKNVGGFMEGHVCFLRSDLASITPDTSPKEAFDKAINDSLDATGGSIVVHEYTHHIDALIGTVIEAADYKSKLTTLAQKQDDSDQDKDRYYTHYAGRLKEINARLVTFFYYVETVDLPKRLEFFNTKYDRSTGSWTPFTPEEKQKYWNDIKDASSFVDYYRYNVGLKLKGRDKRYYDYLEDEHKEHVNKRLTSYWENDIKSTSSWRIGQRVAAAL